MTHDIDEIPDKWGVGKVDTGHHAYVLISALFIALFNVAAFSVNVSVTSIATYLPSSTEHDNAPFTGTTTRGLIAPSLSPTEEANTTYGAGGKAERGTPKIGISFGQRKM